jgi:biofilm PGA synthesis N-glycosyltransferase PgaC
VAVYMANMKGWRTKTFVERSFFHHRPVGLGQNRVLAARFKLGEKDYFLGGHPVWELFRAGYQMRNKPYVVGAVLILAGYFWRFATRAERPISPELVEFRRKEQMERLRSILLRLIPGRRRPELRSCS